CARLVIVEREVTRPDRAGGVRADRAGVDCVNPPLPVVLERGTVLAVLLVGTDSGGQCDLTTWRRVVIWSVRALYRAEVAPVDQQHRAVAQAERGEHFESRFALHRALPGESFTVRQVPATQVDLLPLGVLVWSFARGEHV